LEQLAMRQLYRALSNICGNDLGSEPASHCGLTGIFCHNGPASSLASGRHIARENSRTASRQRDIKRAHQFLLVSVCNARGARG